MSRPVAALRRRAGATLTALARSSPGRRWQARRLRHLADEGAPVRLHLGCGPRLLSGWVNIDYVWGADVLLDLRRPIPLPDATVDYIFSEDFLEHMPFLAGKGLLAECARVLKPGGVLRVATPDLAGLVRAYTDRSEPGLAWYRQHFGHVTTYAQMLNTGMRAWGHQFLYDEEVLRATLLSLGLQVERARFGESADPELCNLEYRDSAEGAQSMYIEARRPASQGPPATNPRY